MSLNAVTTWIAITESGQDSTTIKKQKFVDRGFIGVAW